MKPDEIVRLRLINQLIANSSFTNPEDVVQWMVAMQAQEYAQSKWAVGMRLAKATDQVVEKAFHDGKILRTHLMRPTWHFVAPGDIRWLLKLTAPRVHQANAFMYRKLDLDKKLLKRAADVLTKNLEGGHHLTRNELNEFFKRKKIIADGHRLSYIMMYAELEGVICSGLRKGKQFTYALLEERVPATKKMTTQEALAGFTERYFTSRGPATAKDFSYWSGLTMQEVKKGIATLSKDFLTEEINGQTFIFKPGHAPAKKLQSTFLMADYDEYGMSYKDRSAIFIPESSRAGNPVFNHMLVINGKLSGTWSQELTNKGMQIQTAPFIRLTTSNETELKRAVKKYIDFFN